MPQAYPAAASAVTARRAGRAQRGWSDGERQKRSFPSGPGTLNGLSRTEKANSPSRPERAFAPSASGKERGKVLSKVASPCSQYARDRGWHEESEDTSWPTTPRSRAT